MAKTQTYGKDIFRVVTLAVTFITSQQRHIENKGTALQSQVRWRIWTLKCPSMLKCHSAWCSGLLDLINPFCGIYSGEDFSGTYYAKLPKQDGIYIEPGHDFWAATGCSDDIHNSGLKTRGCQGQETGGRRKAVWLLPVNNGGRGVLRKGMLWGEQLFLCSRFAFQMASRRDKINLSTGD